MLSYNFYSTVYKGNKIKSEEEWDRLYKDAEIYVSDVCNMEIPEDLADHPAEKVYRDLCECLCKLAELLQSQEEELKRSSIVSESTDGYSVHYTEYSKSKINSARYEIVSGYLSRHGLLYPSGKVKTLKSVSPVKPEENPVKCADLQIEPKIIFNGKLNMNRIVFNEPVYPPCKISIYVSIPTIQNPKITNFEDLYVSLKPNIILNEYGNIPDGSYQPVFFIPFFYGNASSTLASEFGLNGSNTELKDFVNSGNFGLQQWDALIRYEYPYRYEKTETKNLFKPVEPFGRNNTTDSLGRWEEEINFGLWDITKKSRFYSELSEFGSFGLGYRFRDNLPVYSSDSERMAFLGLDFSNLDLNRLFLNNSMDIGEILRSASFRVYSEKVG